MYLTNSILAQVGVIFLWAFCCGGGVALITFANRFSANGTRRINRAIFCTGSGIGALIAATVFAVRAF